MTNEGQSITRTLPVVAIRGTVAFPFTDSIFSFGRPKSIAAVNTAFQEDRVVAVFTQKDARTADPGFDDLYQIGTIATITQMMSTDGEIHAMVKGQVRAKLEEVVATDPYMIGRITEISQIDTTGDEVQALARQLLDLFKKAINLGKSAEITAVMRVISGQTEPAELVDLVSSMLDIKLADKQKLLESPSVQERIEKVIEYLVHEINVLEIERTISTKTQKSFEDKMRKAMLEEKKKAIESELGESEEGVSGDEIAEYKKKIVVAKMPKEVEEKAKKELNKLVQMNPHNPEGGYLRNYLDWLVDMPWSVSSPNNVSLAHAAQTLEEDHYGIDKAKERILEFLAVMKLKKEGVSRHKDKNNTQDSQSTILCFIGPPGVGKTSIGKSIAKALGRKFVRVSLGGIRDEAEIRGHRRTYVGALPGRIIQGVKNSGTNNPVFMLDEIDKLGVDFRGDPSSALLEALDPEQNREFSDHYLEVPFDLSHVMFICTGNILDTIPVALRDRMEIINFPGYIEDEKFYIAQKFLWPKQLVYAGINSKKINITDVALRDVIVHYTREAGVRNLERNLATICRKVARLVAENKKYPNEIKITDLRKFLGPTKFSSLIAEKNDEVGMSTGLAVTPAGGEILFIEVALMPGKGRLTLTGQLGDIMKESAKAAFTWIKAHWYELGLKQNFALNMDVHVHVPEGAVPKDGTSAGIAITTALVSAVTGIAVRRNVGMTGEMTLRGRVLEIGGVKEKVIAGHRAGLKTIILPRDNKKDMEDVPQNIKKDIKFVFVARFEEVLGEVMKTWPPKIERRKVDKSLNIQPLYLRTT